MQKYDLALADYNKAIELNEQYAIAYYNRGLLYDDQQKYDLALSDYNKAIEIDPLYALAFTNRSESKENIGDIKGACADAKKAFSLGEEDANESWIEKNCKFLKDI